MCIRDSLLSALLSVPCHRETDALDALPQTFAPILGSQDVPNRLYFHLKKDIFPRVYWSSFLKVRTLPSRSDARWACHTDSRDWSVPPQGTWFGPKGFFRPVDYMHTA